MLNPKQFGEFKPSSTYNNIPLASTPGTWNLIATEHSENGGFREDDINVHHEGEGMARLSFTPKNYLPRNVEFGPKQTQQTMSKNYGHTTPARWN